MWFYLFWIERDSEVVTGSLCVVQAGLKLSLILLPPFPKCGVTGAFLLEAVFEVLVMVGSVMVLHL